MEIAEEDTVSIKKYVMARSRAGCSNWAEHGY